MKFIPHAFFRTRLRGRRFVVVSLLTFFGFVCAGGLALPHVNASGASLRERATQLLARTTPGRAMLATYFATQTVINGNDTGSGSLRDALATASDGNTIVFSGVTTVTLTSGELVVNKSVTIDGGTGVTVTRSSGTFRIFNVTDNNGGVVKTVVMNDLTISNGQAAAGTSGSGINNLENLTLTRCTITGNSGGNQSGGIHNSGTMTITDSVISNNNAPQGGGIQNNNSLTMTGSLIKDNTTSGFGAGLLVFGSFTDVKNCTFTGNSAPNDNSGAIGVDASVTATFTNCTITGNSDLSGGAGVTQTRSPGADIVLKNCIVINNTSTNGSPDILNSVNASSSNNLIGTGGSGGLTNGTNGNQVGVSVASALLGTLGNYGGLTKTFPLLPGSPAINAGNTANAPTTDQRGKSRVGTADIGAFESQGFTLTVNGGNNQSANVNTAFANPLSVNVSSSASPAEPVNGGKITFTPPASGASATIAGSPATITSGVATTGTVTANGTAGNNYTVTAKASTTETVDFTLSNTTPPAPTVGNFATTSVNLAQQATVTPDAAPTNATSIVATASSGFNGTLAVDKTTGVVRVTNASPAGTFTITVTATNATSTAAKSFTLTVQSGTACGTVPLFTSAADVTGVNTPLGTAVGDFNNDGKQDLVTTNGSNATVSIRLGDGAGGFTGTTTVSTPSNPNAVAVGDFNGDGNQDIAVSSSNNAVAIRLGDGAGGFTGTTNITTGQTTKSIAVGDFNNDGKLDFVTANIGGDNATVALGDGAGGFPTVSTVSVGDGPGQVVVADFNNDGKLDFATSNQIFNAPNFGSPGTVTVRIGNGDGTFTNGPSYIVGDNPEYLAVGDFNEDGKPDLITSNQNSSSLSLILGDVSNTVTPPTPTTISVSSGPGEIRVADINKDGHQDVAFKRSGFENFAYLLGTGTGSFGTAVIVPVTGAAGTKLAVGDFNADGYQDFVTANFGSNTLFVRLGGCNVAPTIMAGGPLTRQQGSTGISDTIATVNDTETPKANLTVTVMSAPTGISVTSISAPDATTGAVTATVTAACNAATGNNSVVLKVTDGNGATATANLTVTVNAATPPTPANAGADQSFCNITTVTMGANTPSVGTGAWSVVSGPSTSTAQFNSLTNPAANFTPTGGTGIYTLRWTITGACATSTDDVVLTFSTPPTTANAGLDQSLCTTSAALLAANTPSVGTGAWTVVSGPSTSTAQFNSTSSAAATFTPAAGAGTYTLRWTISNGFCTASTDDVVLTYSAPPTTANAGPDQTLCTTSAAMLAANTPSAGTGAWTVVSGPSTSTAQFNSLTNPTATFTPAGGVGTYTLRWTISSGACTASTDDVVLIYSAPPTTANAGSDQTLCDVTSVTMAGNAASVGTGTWMQVNGPNTATITSPNSPTTTMTGLVAGVYTFQWTIANAPCTASSDQVMVTINAAPAITTQPTNQSVLLNGTATFMAAASGTPAPTVKWQVSTDNGANYTDLSGQTSNTLTLNNVTAGMNGNRYRAVFANSCITINSSAATLTIGCVSSLTVNNTGDGADATPGNGVCETATGNGICTLRAAIQEANALTTCTPFTINFNVALPGTITLGSDLPTIAHPNLTITGPGADQLTVSGASLYRPFNIGNGNYAVTISGLTVANGRGNGGGGLINLSTAQVSLNNMTFDSNAITGSSGGGGIRHVNSGTLNVTGSTFLNNNSTGTGGGGINNFSTNGTVNVTNCTFSGNLANLGGGIHNQSSGTTNVTNCTLVSNSGGINNNSGTVSVKNTIAVGNGTDINGTVTASNNLTGLQSAALLSALGNYGGTTQTFALLPGSPAINAGTSSGAPATDQRGIARPQQSAVDIGAFESRGFTLAVNSGNNQSTPAGSNFTNPLKATVTSANSEPVDGGQVTFTPPNSGATATVAGSPATISSGVATSGTVTANLIIGGPYNVTASANGATSINFALTNTNSAPTFTPASAISRQQGSSAGVAVTVGTVNDAQTAAGSLVVTQITGGTAVGVSVTNITNTNGTIMAQISAGCTAVAGTVRFQVSDGGLTNTGDFQVNVTSNDLPTLVYGNASVAAGGSTSNSPTTATDNGSITGYSVQSQGTYTGTIAVNSSGVISISNAAPVGSHTIKISATDNCGASKEAMFTLMVNSNPPTIIAASALTRQRGSSTSNSPIATVGHPTQTAGTLSITATTVPTGILVTNIVNNNGAVTANVAADCTATLGPNTVVLTVTDSTSAMATANLTVNVLANSAPTVGNYPNSAVVPNGSLIVTPSAAPSDNGSIVSVTATAPGFSGTFSGNSTTGAITINNAGPVGDYPVTVTVTDNCGTSTQQTFTLSVGLAPPLNVKLGDPATCLEANGLVGVEVTVSNPNNSMQSAFWNVILPAGLTAVPGSCNASVDPAGCAVAPNGGSLSWNGMLAANQTVTIVYRARIGANVGQGAQLCLENKATVAGVNTMLQYCFNVVCPAIANARVADAKPGSVLVFPYYTSAIGGGSDTRMTISNTSNAAPNTANQAYVHVFFIDGASCQQADLFLCLTPNASFSFKASEYDPDSTGYVIAVAVDRQGVPIQNNVLIGNAFVTTPTLADNYGANSFFANSFAVATVNGNTATLYFDQVGYDAVPRQFAVEIQSPIDAIGQQVVTAGLSGDMTMSQLSGAAQIGTGQAFNEKEVFGSFNQWLLGTCQARSSIATNSPRVPNGLGNLIKTGQAGTLKFNVGGAVGLLLTPRTGTWKGIRTLHQTQTTVTTLTIPLLVPVC